ncbi:hypothetical protein [Mesobacillus jeotgali]|uniref:Uncharacterized protein n=1 Tax=Mesobacillus jeotgali TaxID=129985 RepID=A0ABY9VHF2_9BACI|nr:hypothetical protein [Mesobacillus jeotgali]WNF23382.1 hypothetical protein RH061_02410 [Mesobacillus jeotgali]
MLFTKGTNFNPLGFHYQFDQENMLMTMEEGFWDKQVVEKQVTPQEALEIMLPINEAKQLWEVNIYLIALFAAVFIALFFTPLKTKKYFRWYVVLYMILLVSFIIWDVAQHQEIAETLLS